ncbi:MAG: fibronectin type III domain-containing protein [Sedimentisphaerales bacterium]|nr:fibronectin type III domain-containing protein [Sedimentisphaerales bacterium]
MGRFPNAESEVATLATEMAAGLTDHADVFDAPPIPAETLGTLLASYNQSRTAVLDTQTAAQTATASKEVSLGQLVGAMKKDIRYAENKVGAESEQLYLIGWSPRRAPTPLAAPGQARVLAVARQEESCVDLSWKSPDDGGRPSAYRVVRRERPEGPWQDVATAVETQVDLIDQPRGKEFEYRVVAVNKAGEGEPSNTVVVVL